MNSVSRPYPPSHSLEERLDTSSAAGELVFHVFGAIAHFERRLAAQPHLWSGQQVADGQRSAGTARRFAQNGITIGH